LPTTGIGIEEAIQEAVDRIYEMGRWPGTTVEIELAESDFVAGLDDHEWFIYFNEELYDGAIGFRNNYRGWAIVDHTCLYRDGINAGDREFLDMGTIPPEANNIIISGILSPSQTFTVYPVVDEVTGLTAYQTGDTYPRLILSPVSSPPAAPDSWGLYYLPTTNLAEASSWGATYTEDPLDADDWEAFAGSAGSPILTASPSYGRRKYRAPLGFVPSEGPNYALMKLEAPTLKDDTIIPIHSAGALKCAILAVCQEYVNDDDRAMLNWQKFESFIVKAARQVDGPKRMTIGINSSLRRKPTQFL
jgi:hypothetical protein